MNKFLLLLSLGFIALSASSVAVQSDISILDNYKYETPRGRPMKIPQEVELVLIAFEKATGNTVNNLLNTKNKYYLQKNKAIFIADVHRMPSVITSMFTLPKMKKYKHLIYLHYGDKFENAILHKDNMITVLHVNNRTITNISFISNKNEVEAIIEK